MENAKMASDWSRKISHLLSA